MNWWLRTYHHDGTSAEVVGPGELVTISAAERECRRKGYETETFHWAPGEPIPGRLPPEPDCQF